MPKPLYGLIPQCFPKHKRWALCEDYHDQLDEGNKAWLDRFNREFHDGSIRKGDDQAIHKSDEMRKKCYSRNNAQNRDLYSIKSCSGRLNFDLFGVGSVTHEEECLERVDDEAQAEHPLAMLANVLVDLET